VDPAGRRMAPGLGLRGAVGPQAELQARLALFPSPFLFYFFIFFSNSKFKPSSNCYFKFTIPNFQTRFYCK
jgi:hypothetical protein